MEASNNQQLTGNCMKKFLVLVLVSILFPPLALRAETHVLRAASDFPILDGTSTPFYVDRKGGLDILAIDAGQTAYRGKFARAETTFSGAEDNYDLTLTTLGEIDGECIYQILVNGELLATFTNAPTDTDYVQQTFLVEDIAIPTGATIAVEAMAVSNGLIPEHDVFAFARGRWYSLKLDSSETLPEDVDLKLTSNNLPASVTLGDEFTFNLIVENLATDTTATGVSIMMDLPLALEFVSAEECTLNSGKMACALPEIGPLESHSTSVTLSAITSQQTSLLIAIESDQNDSNTENNERTADINIEPEEILIIDNASEPDIDSAESDSSGSGAFFLFGIAFWLIRNRRT